MKYLLAMFLMSFMVSCATTKFEKDEVKKVKKVAVVGQLLTQDKLKDAEEVKNAVVDGLLSTGMSMLGFGGNSEEENPMMSSENITKKSDHAELIFKNLNNQLGKSTEWQFVKMSELAKNNFYQKQKAKQEEKYYYSNSRGSEKIEKFYTKQSFHPLTIQLMDAEEREDLMRVLGVDAIITVSYKTNLTREEAFSANIEAKTVMDFKLYTKDNKEAVIVQSYEGKPISDGKAKAGVIGFSEDKKLVNDLIVRSTYSANDNLIKNLKEQL